MVGWGANYEAWVIEYTRYFGETQMLIMFGNELDNYLKKTI